MACLGFAQLVEVPLHQSAPAWLLSLLLPFCFLPFIFFFLFSCCAQLTDIKMAKACAEGLTPASEKLDTVNVSSESGLAVEKDFPPNSLDQEKQFHCGTGGSVVGNDADVVGTHVHQFRCKHSHDVRLRC
jgi:hypothetical protein